MELNIANIPKAIIYFVIGVFINIIFFYIFSPSQVGLIDILSKVFSAPDSLTGIIWIGIMTISILFNLALPVWMLVDTED